MEGDRILFLSAQYESDVEMPEEKDIRPYGVYAKIKQMGKLHGNLVRVMVDITDRGRIEKYVQTDPYFVVEANPINTDYENTTETDVSMRIAKKLFHEYAQIKGNLISKEIVLKVQTIKNAHELIDVICANIPFEDEDAQYLLGEENVNKRLDVLNEKISKEINLLNLELKIMRKVKSNLDEMQKSAFISEQIRVLQEELGERSSDNIAEEYKQKLQELNLSQETAEKIEKEIKRLEMIPLGSSEAGVVQTYIETILELPWNTSTPEMTDIKEAKQILQSDHYAMDKVKERVLEYLSVITLAKSLKSPILCLVGPPGVGKTSIAKSIAHATGRKYIRMSLGGLRDEAEIRGHRRTYIGSMPGRIITGIKQAGTNNPLFLLDEIDKLAKDFRGDPASALLEALDPEQNSTFTDNYLEVPFDLSNVMFVTTANSLSAIPEPLLDRMETIEVDGYIAEEKYHIAKQFLLPKQIKQHGLKEVQLLIEDDAITDIINNYTSESGVRELDRKIAKICRKTAKEILEDQAQSVTITRENLEHYLSKPKNRYDIMTDKKNIGIVNGLAWTRNGGDTLKVEALVMKGKGNLVLTGQLGDVMKESAQAAHSLIRANAEIFNIDYESILKHDVHLHFPEGAIPKDGPSAGIAISTAMLSAFIRKGVSERIAMTGEITLSGHVLPIGGLREKLLAASRAGITDVLIPKENKRDLEDVPASILDKLTIHLVEDIKEVFEIVFG
jgi:ATP-dependent Lon protease